MVEKLLNQNIDCITFDSIKTRYYIEEKSFSCHGAIRFWVDYKKPFEFRGLVTEESNTIECKIVQADVSKISESEIMLVHSDSAISKIHVFVVNDSFNSIHALLFDINNQSIDKLTQILIYQDPFGHDLVLFLTCDESYISDYLNRISKFTSEIILA